MDEKRVCAHSGNYERTTGFGLPKSILADAETFTLVMGTLAFTAALMMVPTVMALLKSWGVW